MLHQVRVDGVAAGIHATRDEDDITDLQLADLRLGDRRPQRNLAAGPREPGGDEFRRQHRLRLLPVAIHPRVDRPGRRVEANAETAERPAVVGDRNEEARRQPVERADLAADQRRPSAEPHRPDGEPVGLVHDRRFELRQPRVRVGVIQGAEQLFLGVEIPRRPITADAHTHRAGAATFPLRLPDRVQNALAHAFERAIGAAKVIEVGRQRVLRVGILAAAALQDQPHLDLIPFPLVEVDDRRTRARGSCRSSRR